MGPLLHLTRRTNNGPVVRATEALNRAARDFAEVVSLIAEEDVASLDEPGIRTVCRDYFARHHDLRIAAAELLGFTPDEDIAEPAEITGELIAAYRDVLEGRRRIEGFVEADVLTPALMAAE